MKLPEHKLEPFMLPPGTLVGPWKVKAYAGGGAYGLVFRAVRAGDEAAGEVALKVACYPGDERFQREVELLSRVHHPSVPRLLGHGQWQPLRGEAHPFIVMEWVEGMALYTWAEWRNASSHQALQVLGQIAGAVAATHAAGGVHRDIKGGNIRSSDLGPASRPVPQTPLDDQQRAPYCVPGAEITIHGGCWVEVPSVKPPCKEPFYEWQGSCYVPSLSRRRKPTSDPQ